MVGLYILVLLSAFTLSFAEFEITRADTSQIERPCDFEDLTCISYYFNQNDWCPSSITPDASPYQVPYMSTRAPALNGTAEDIDLVFEGLDDGYVQEFYINPITNAALLSLRFEEINIQTDSVYLFHQPLSEDLRVSIADTVAYYPSITIRILTHGDNKFHPSSSNINTFVDVVPDFEFPGADKVTDPKVLYYLDQISKSIKYVIQELFVERGKHMFLYYFKNIICNYDSD